MTRYTVVTRRECLPIRRFITIEQAADYIVKEAKFAEWTVLAQEANRITVSTPYRELLPHEKKKLEQRLYPTLFEE